MLSLSELQEQWREGMMMPAGLDTPIEGLSEHPALTLHRKKFFDATGTVLAERYPTVEALVGSEFFRVMARDFILAEPPGSSVIMDYGADFAAFIARYPAVRDLPFLADVAGFEWDMHLVRYAAEPSAEIFTAEDFAGLSKEALVRLELDLIPAARIFVSDYAVAELWHAHWVEPLKLSRLGRIEDVTCVLMVRQNLEVSVIGLTWGQAVFLESIRGGAGLGVATARALEEDETHDMVRSNAKLAHTGCLMARA